MATVEHDFEAYVRWLDGIVAPDGRAALIEHAADFAAAGIPFIFDPGQGLPMFGGEDLKTFIRQASWVIVNDYEWSLLAEAHRLPPGRRGRANRGAVAHTRSACAGVREARCQRARLPSL